MKNKEESINGNYLVLSNSILLISLVYAIIESLNKLPNVRLFIIIFGLILVGTLLVSNFLIMISNQIKDELRKKVLLASYLLSSSMYLLLFIFIMVIMIVM